MSESSGLDWMRKGECAKPENSHLDFFSTNTEEKYEAKNLCFTCPVRESCVKWAMENEEISGIWGGRDENETRRNLSVSSEGVEVRRNRFPQCPYCAARTSQLLTKTIDRPGGGRWVTARAVECMACGFEWQSRSSANAVDAYYADKLDRAEKLKKRLARKRRSTKPTEPK